MTFITQKYPLYRGLQKDLPQEYIGRGTSNYPLKVNSQYQIYDTVDVSEIRRSPVEVGSYRKSGVSNAVSCPNIRS